MARKWLPHRRAYAPRAWPVTLPIAFGMAAVAYVFVPPLYVLIPAAGIVGIAASMIRWAVFRRRHPVIPLEEYLDDLRRAARWN